MENIFPINVLETYCKSSSSKVYFTANENNIKRFAKHFSESVLWQ